MVLCSSLALHLLPNVDGIIGFQPPRHLHRLVYRPKEFAVRKKKTSRLTLNPVSSHSRSVQAHTAPENLDHSERHGDCKAQISVKQLEVWKEEVQGVVTSAARPRSYAVICRHLQGLPSTRTGHPGWHIAAQRIFSLQFERQHSHYVSVFLPWVIHGLQRDAFEVTTTMQLCNLTLIQSFSQQAKKEIIWMDGSIILFYQAVNCLILKCKGRRQFNVQKQVLNFVHRVQAKNKRPGLRAESTKNCQNPKTQRADKSKGPK